MQKLRAAQDAGCLQYDPGMFEQLLESGTASIQDVNVRAVVEVLQKAGSRALQNSPLLNQSLMAYVMRSGIS